MLPTLLWVSSFGIDTFFAKPVYRFNSPDNGHYLSVSRRINFPVMEVISEPSATVRVELRRNGSSEVVGHVQFEIYEFDDLKEPELEWTADHVRVTGMEQYDEIDFSFQLTAHLNQPH